MPQAGRLEQFELPGFPHVAHKDRLRTIRAWSGYRWRANTLVQVNDGTSPSDTLSTFIRAHPYILGINVVTLSGADLAGYYNTKTTRYVRVRASLEATEFIKRNESLPRGSGWSQKSCALGILSRMRLDDGTDVHIPMVRFGKFMDASEISQYMAPFGTGYLFDDGQEGHYYWGSNLLPTVKWLSFLKFCYDKVEGVDRYYIEHATDLRATVMRLFGIERYQNTPQVTHIISSPS